MTASPITAPHPDRDTEVMRQGIVRELARLRKLADDLRDDLEDLTAMTVPAAPVNAQYVVLAANATLTAEAVLTAGNGIDLAGATVTVDETELSASSLGGFAEAVDDRVAALLTNSTTVTWAYNDGANTLTASTVSVEGVSNAVRRLLALDANVSIADTTTETAILSYTVAANTVPDDRSIRVCLFGDHLNNSGGNRSWQIRIRLNGVSLYDSSTQVYATNAAQRPWTLDFEVVRKTATTCALGGRYWSLTSATQPTVGLGLIDATGNTGGPFTSGATDPTVAWGSSQTLEVLVTPSGAGANCQFHLRGGFVELV